MLERLFKLSALKTNVKTEVLAGLTTYLTMAYIIFVNPAMLAQAGMDQGAVFVATCLAAAVGCFVMGLWANLPVAQAPGMGLNAFFTYSVVLGSGHSWQVALGAVFLSGLIFVVLSLFKFREWIINTIPTSLKKAITAGIGAFLALIALKNAGIVVDNPATLVSMGDISGFSAAMMVLSLMLIIGFVQRGFSAAVVFAILIVSVLGLIFGDVTYTGIVSAPPSIMPTLLQMDIAGALEISMVVVIFTFLFVDLFDTSGTLIAVTERAGLVKKDGKVPNLNRALLADSTATVAGAALGTSTTTSYIESAAGAASGGRSGLVAVTAGVLFVLSIFISPLASMIPPYATAGAIFYVAVLMMFSLKDIDWQDLSEAVPVTIVLLLTPLTFSIADGITLGFISYALVKLITFKFKELNPSILVLSTLLLLKLIFIG